MRVFISIGFDEKTIEKFMEVRENLKKCSRKGMFCNRDEFKLGFLMLYETEDYEPIKQLIEKLEITPFKVKFKGVDRSRREGGDIYWTVAEKSPELAEIYSQVKQTADENGYKYEAKPFKARVQMGKNIIARPNFEMKEFEGTVKKISIEKYVQYMGKDIYKELYVKEIND